MGVRLVFFDVGGVLADDMHLPLLQKLARTRYADREDAEARFIEAGIRAWRRFELSPQTSEDAFWAEVIRDGRMRESIEELKGLLRTERMIPYWPVREVAARLAAAGVPLGIISNHCAPWFAEIAAILRLDEIFPPDLVVTSFDVGAAKPDPRIFEAAMERARRRLPELSARECLFLDDKARNIDAAVALGLVGCRFDARTEPLSRLLATLRAHGLATGE